MNPLQLIFTLFLMQVICYWLLDKYHLAKWKYVSLGLLIVSYIFIIPNLYLPDNPQHKPMCGMPMMAIRFGFWFLGCGAAIVTHFIYVAVKDIFNERKKLPDNHVFPIDAFCYYFCMGCSSASKIARINMIDKDNKDVIALSYLIRNYMRQTKNTNYSLSDIIRYDTSARITHHFSAIAVADWPNIWSGGYIVYFKFSANRNNDSVTLTALEKTPLKMKTKEKIGRNKEQLSLKYDGEIHFYFPERQYHIAAIILKKNKN